MITSTTCLILIGSKDKKTFISVRTLPPNNRRLCPKRNRKAKEFRAIWAEKSDFGAIVVSPSMVADHRPDNVAVALKQVRLVKAEKIVESSF